MTSELEHLAPASPPSYWTSLSLERAGVVAAALTLFVALAIDIRASLQSFGHIVFTVDDAYIHLGMARSLAEQGVYGVVPASFSSASSSPLWTLTLAALMLVAPSSLYEWVSLFAGSAAAIAVLWMLIRTAAREIRSASHAQALAFCLLAASLPLVLGQLELILSGMEHGLHMAVTMAFGLAAAAVLSRSGPAWPMLVLGALMTVVRFESVAPVFLAAGLLGWQRRWKLALALIAGSLGAIAVQGAWSMAHGEAFLPNSVMVKIAIHAPGGAAAPGAGPTSLAAGAQLAAPPPALSAKLLAFVVAILTRWGANLGHSFGVLMTLVAVLFLAAFRLGQGKLAQFDRVLVLLMVGTVGAQTAMGGSTAAMERYQSYLTGFALLALARLGPPLWFGTATGLRQLAATWAPVLALPLAFVPTLVRETRGKAGQMADVYIEHWIPAGMLAQALPQGTVVVEDLGAIAWRRPLPLIDIFGLATHEVAKQVVKRGADGPFFDKLARDRGALAALVRPLNMPLEPSYRVGSRPKSWIPIGFIGRTSHTSLNQAIALFAIDPAQFGPLTQALVKLRAEGPAEIRVVLASEPEGQACVAGWSPSGSP